MSCVSPLNDIIGPTIDPGKTYANHSELSEGESYRHHLHDIMHVISEGRFSAKAFISPDILPTTPDFPYEVLLQKPSLEWL